MQRRHVLQRPGTYGRVLASRWCRRVVQVGLYQAGRFWPSAAGHGGRATSWIFLDDENP